MTDERNQNTERDETKPRDFSLGATICGFIRGAARLVDPFAGSVRRAG